MRCYKKELFDKLDNLQNQNPKAYWNLVEQLKSDTKNENKSVNINLDEWKHHFQRLNGNNPKNSSLDLNLKRMEEEIIFNELDFKITESEIVKAIKT